MKAWNIRFCAFGAFLLFVFIGMHAEAAESVRLNVTGIWGTKYGEMKVVQKGDTIEGTLVKTTEFCPFKNGRKLLTGILMEDSLVGKYYMCQADDDCGQPVWAHAVLLVTDKGSLMTGSASSSEALCPLVGFSKSEGGERALYFKRLSTSIAEEKSLPGPPAAPGTYDPRVAKLAGKEETKLLVAGARLMEIGKFEKARKKFEAVLKLVPNHPNALLGIGVTYKSRNQFKKALKYYKKALAANPNYGIAYYNMACIYALQKKPKLAFEYLRIALLNGFIVEKVMDEDPDLSSLREMDEYKKIKEAAKKAKK